VIVVEAERSSAVSGVTAAAEGVPGVAAVAVAARLGGAVADGGGVVVSIVVRSILERGIVQFVGGPGIAAPVPSSDCAFTGIGAPAGRATSSATSNDTSSGLNPGERMHRIGATLEMGASPNEAVRERSGRVSTEVDPFL
jgi:hypothetical protein